MRSRFNTVVVFTTPPTRHYMSPTTATNIDEMHESIKNRSIVVKIQSVFPIGDAWFYGPHVTKVYVSYGNMDDVRHAKSTPGGGHVAKVHVFHRKSMVLGRPCVKIVWKPNDF